MDTKISWEKLQNQTEVFIDKLNIALDELGIRDICKNLEIDHICVRLKDTADVASLKQELEVVGKIISAVQVNGREIIIIQLNQPISLSGWQTYGIELPNPKPNHNYQDGWEHVEFVFSNVENTMDGVREAFIEKFPHLDLEQLKEAYSYSEDEPHADGDQLPNPTVGLKVNGVGIKFHANSIQKVVGYFK
jgi:uncharacterized protein